MAIVTMISSLNAMTYFAGFRIYKILPVLTVNKESSHDG